MKPREIVRRSKQGYRWRQGEDILRLKRIDLFTLAHAEPPQLLTMVASGASGQPAFETRQRAKRSIESMERLLHQLVYSFSFHAYRS